MASLPPSKLRSGPGCFILNHRNKSLLPFGTGKRTKEKQMSPFRKREKSVKLNGEL